MKKLISTFSLIILAMVMFGQGQPASWSGAAGVKASHHENAPKSNAPTLLPSGSLLWSQLPACSAIGSSEIMSAYDLVTNSADNFMFTSAKDVTSVLWYFGIYNGTYSPFTTWNITIYNNATCLPSNIVQQWTIPFSMSHESLHCLDSYYMYWADLTPAFTAAANTEYWISVQTGDHVFNGQWGWEMATAINGCPAAFQSAYFGFPNYVNGAQVFGYDSDFAFDLYGTDAVPQTPISNWALFIGIGLILVFTVIRFRRIL